MEGYINQLLPVAVMIVSILAFIVQIITELIKDIGFMKKIPTNIVVIVLSIILTALTYIIFCSHLGYQIYWYGVVGSCFGGFIVAYVASYGWEKLHYISKRLRKQ